MNSPASVRPKNIHSPYSACLRLSHKKYSYAHDLDIGTPGFPLSVARKYESGMAMDGVNGFGWTLNLTAHLYYATFLYAAPSTYQKEADVVLPNGDRNRFGENADGTFAPPPYRYDTLVRNAGGTFDLAIADGTTKYHFTAKGALDTIADEFGNTLLFTYDANGRLQRAADQAGSGRYLEGRKDRGQAFVFLLSVNY